MGGGRSSCRSLGIAARCPAVAGHLCSLLTCALVCWTLCVFVCVLSLMLRCSWAVRDPMVVFKVLLVSQWWWWVACGKSMDRAVSGVRSLIHDKSGGGRKGGGGLWIPQSKQLALLRIALVSMSLHHRSQRKNMVSNYCRGIYYALLNCLVSIQQKYYTLCQ